MNHTLAKVPNALWVRSLVDYANDAINLSQLYNAIGSRAGGKWQDALPEEEEEAYYELNPEDEYPPEEYD